jgi:hypothetical protein
MIVTSQQLKTGMYFKDRLIYTEDIVLSPVETAQSLLDNHAPFEIPVGASEKRVQTAASDVESDAASLISQESIFSNMSISSSNSSLVSVSGAAVDCFTDTIMSDPEILNLCKDAMDKYGSDRMERNLHRLLKQFFVDLSAEIRTPHQRLAVRFLRSRRQRWEIVRSTCMLCNVSSEDNIVTAPDIQDIERWRLQNLDNMLQQSTAYTAVPISETLEDETDTQSVHEIQQVQDLDSEYLGKNLDIFNFPELRAIIEFFTRGIPFKDFKQNFRNFVYPMSALPEAITNCNSSEIKKLLSESFEQVATGEYAWLNELDDIGYSRHEIAELLLEIARDSPWIYFERQEHQEYNVDVNIHQESCVHQGGRTPGLKSNSINILSSDDEHEHISLVATPKAKELIKLVQETCGIAGVAPTSRDLTAWNGTAIYDDEDLKLSVTYTFSESDQLDPVSSLPRIHRSLMGFAEAVAHVQANGLCCGSFTVLTEAFQSSSNNLSRPVIEMHRVALAQPMKLFDELDSVTKLSEIKSESLKVCKTLAIEILSNVCSKEAWTTRNAVDDIDETLHICALAVQFLCLAFLSYTRAHTGALRPFFLDCPVHGIDLYGTKTVRSDQPELILRLEDLTCMSEMTRDAVLIFRAPGGKRREGEIVTQYDLFASPEDLMDTWGPGEFVKTDFEDNSGKISAINIGGGTFKSSEGKDDMFHWSPTIVATTPVDRGFSQNTKILIGGAVTVNHACPVDKDQRWLVSAESLENLGVSKSTWNPAERQAGIQSGQFANLQFNQTWIKSPGSTLKQVQLTLPGNNIMLPFLQSEWGLQVSLCTSVARRVPLRELIADVMPDFVESQFPVPSRWATLKADYKIIEAFRGLNIQEWLDQLDPELQDLVARIVRNILLTLQHTGIDKKGDHLIIAWIQKNKPFQCFRASCDKDSYWTRILADSEDCATFAYVTSNCLETEWLKCRGPTATWPNTTALLETAVCRDKPGENPRSMSGPVTPWVLKDADFYSMGKLDSLLWVEVKKPPGNESPKLYVKWSKIPMKIRFRLDVRNIPRRFQRLRERQTADSPAEQVFILGGKK